VDAGQPFTVLVDYAHKPDALEKALSAARRITRARLLCVFGCGGDRDRGKRPIMGGLAESGADFTFVTSDNPRTEDPSRIIGEIVSGMQDKKRYEVIEDREKAIAAAIGMAADGDTVLIAGKGHEDYQIVGTKKHPFDDRETARKYLRLKVKENGTRAS
jgi:UDP-N-acetylmuramyl-tripeptide synthetase